MKIIWLGQSCFQLVVNLNKEEKVVIVIDPFSSEVGFKLPRVKADILLVSHCHSDHSNVKGVLGEPFLATEPGEYEIKNIFIKGISAFHDSVGGKERGKVTIYKIEAEDLKICHLGDLGQEELTNSQIGEIGSVDILMIPVGGVYTIGAKTAAKIISQVEPKIVIPMHYKIPKLKIRTMPRSARQNLDSSLHSEIKLESLDDFLKIMGQKMDESVPLDKLSIKARDLPEEGLKLIVMKP